MQQARIWTGKALQPEALILLAGIATITVSSTGERGKWYEEAQGSDVIMPSGEPFVTGEVMDRIGPRLRIIARTGIGVDRVDLDAATERGVLVINSPDGPTESTAEHTIALMLALTRRVMETDRVLRAGQPYPTLAQVTPGFEVFGATLGLVGLGRIGSRVAAIASVLGMHVLAYDPLFPTERAQALGVELLPTLEEMLPRVQMLSLHCPATPQTRHIIHAGTLQLLPTGSYLINVARGTLIDEAALLDALRSGHLAGAALDVYDPEPPMTSHPLFSLPNTICTPHIGSYTLASLKRMQVMTCEQIVVALRGERPANLVNAEVWGKHSQRRSL